MALAARKVSVVNVCNAVNAVLGQAELKKAGELKEGKLSKATKTKEAVYTVSEGGSQWKLPVCIVTTFDTWAGMVGRMESVASMGCAVPIPPVFDEWLAKFVKTEVEVEA